MNITASKFNSRVKNIVTGLLILCILVNAILWFNGISYSYLYQRLKNSRQVVTYTRQTNLVVRVDTPSTKLSPVTLAINSTKKAAAAAAPTPPQPTTSARRTVKTQPSTKPEEHPWPAFKIPSGVKILKVKWNVSNSAPSCKPTGLGPVFVPWSMKDLTEEVKTRYVKPYRGGLWAPKDCKPAARVAVMVPYRDRPENLQIFSHHMHYFLQKQQLDYGLFVIEQFDKKRFNRAKLFNIGFIITHLMHDYDCLVLHDIDKIPEDTSFSYVCPKYPKHLPGFFRKASDGRNRRKYFSSHYYKGFFGGVSSLRKEHWLTINGMINSYWGWGGEDDELYERLRIKNFRVLFHSAPNSKFVILYHRPDAVYSHRPMPKRNVVRRTMMKDGLNSVTFDLVDIVYEPLFTRIKVRL